VTTGAGSGGLARFVLLVLGWGIVLFGAWYLSAKPISHVTGWIGARLLHASAPVDRVRYSHRDRELLFAVEPDDRTRQRNRLRPTVVLEVRVNPLKYSFGLPLFLALMLAVRSKELARNAAIGVAILVLVAGVGIWLDLYLALASLAAPSGGPMFDLSAAAREAVALGYQLSTLILPSLMPVVLWIAFEWRAIETLVRYDRATSGPAG